MQNTMPITDLPTPARRLGVLVPPANPTVEIEFPVLAPQDTALHFMRLSVLAGDLEARNKAYVESYAASLKGFGSLKLDGIMVAMTGPQYRLGIQGDTDLCKRLSDQAGVPVETASIALLNALRALGETRIHLLSPYPDWLTKLAVEYWEGAGFQVSATHAFSNELVAYQLTPEEVATGIRSAAQENAGTLLLSGTGMRTIDALAATRGSFEQPAISSNLCSVWSMNRDTDVAPSAWMKRVLPNKLQQVASTE